MPWLCSVQSPVFPASLCFQFLGSDSGLQLRDISWFGTLVCHHQIQKTYVRLSKFNIVLGRGDEHSPVLLPALESRQLDVGALLFLWCVSQNCSWVKPNIKGMNYSVLFAVCCCCILVYGCKPACCCFGLLLYAAVLRHIAVCSMLLLVFWLEGYGGGIFYVAHLIQCIGQQGEVYLVCSAGSQFGSQLMLLLMLQFLVLVELADLEGCPCCVVGCFSFCFSVLDWYLANLWVQCQQMIMLPPWCQPSWDGGVLVMILFTLPSFIDVY